MKISEINQLLVSSYNDKEITEKIEISKDNAAFAYNSEWSFINTGTLEPEVKPKVFNYHYKSDDGLELERTHVVSKNQFVAIDTHNKDTQQWLHLDIAEQVPEGILVSKIFIDTGKCEIAARFELFEKERLAENNIDLNKLHPAHVIKSSTITPLTLLTTESRYISAQETEKFLQQVTHIGLQNLYEEFKKAEDLKKDETEQKSFSR